jgi:multiple sugar transport system ATP-binding protein
MNLIALPVQRSGGSLAIAFGERAVLPLPPEAVQRLGSREHVTVGIRPDDLEITPATAGHGDQAGRLEGTVVIAEPLGVTTQVIAKVGDHELVGMADGRFVPQAGEPVALACDVSRLHLFDSETQRTLAI